MNLGIRQTVPLSLPRRCVDESIQGAIVLLIFLAATFGPLIGLGWLIGMMNRRASMKEIFAYVAYWGLIFATWTVIARILSSPFFR